MHDASTLPLEALEPRLLLSESAAAQLSLVSTSGSGASTVYHYNINVTDTGTTNIGTFWFAWVPGEDFLSSVPSAESSPSGWGSALTGSGNQVDGTAIQWIATSNAITPGHSLDGFDFSSADSPSTLAGIAPSHAGTPVLTSFVYSAGPFSDAGFQFVVSPASTVTTGTAPTTTTLTTSAASIQAGTSVTLTAAVAAVTAGGPTPTGTFSFSQNGNALGSVAVDSGGNAVLSTSALPGGSDAVTAAYSGDTVYAASTSASLTETVASPPSFATTIAKSSLPTALVAGSPAAGAVTLNLSNASGGTIKGKVTAQVFATVDGSIDGSAVMLTSSVRAINLKTGRSAVEALPVRIAAATLPAGQYTLVARVIDPSGNNNDSPSGPAITVAAPFVALSETFARTTIPTSAVASTKSRAVAVPRITNNGNITTPGSTTAALFASLSGVVDANATPINSMTQNLRIRAGKSVLLTIPLKQIPALAAGSYTILVQVTDPNGQVTSATAGTLTITTSPAVAVKDPAPAPLPMPISY